MTELMVVGDAGKKMSSREIAELMGKEHRHVLRDIKTLIDHGAITETNFGRSEYKDASGKSNPMYLLDFDATMTLITGYDANRRAMVIKRWRELETGAAIPAFQIPQTLPEALRLAADLAEENGQLQKQIEADKPKTIFADAVSVSHTTILIGELAKLLRQNGIDIGQNRLFSWLRENGYLIKRQGSDWNMPTQQAMDLGLFEIKERSVSDPNGSVRITKTTKVTGKGQVYFINKFLAETKQAA